MADFDFVEEYIKLQPSADRDAITARKAAFEIAKTEAAKTAGRIVDLAHFAFRLPSRPDHDADTWFQDVMRSADPTFSLQREAEEAARIATLVLRDQLVGGYHGTTVAVYAAAFAGKRPTADGHGLSQLARKAMHDSVRKRGTANTPPVVSGSKVASATAAIKKYSTDGAQTALLEALNAITTEYITHLNGVISSSNNAINNIWREKKRLDEEVDLLWWHLGQESFLLDRQISLVPEAARPIVIGADLAAMVNTLPGPYGIYGIARKALGELADQQFKLSEAIRAVDVEFRDLVEDRVEDYAIAPVHGALASLLVDEAPVTGAQFKRKTGLNYDVKLSGYELALQTYHEALLLKLGWFE